MKHSKRSNCRTILLLANCFKKGQMAILFCSASGPSIPKPERIWLTYPPFWRAAEMKRNNIQSIILSQAFIAEFFSFFLSFFLPFFLSPSLPLSLSPFLSLLHYVSSFFLKKIFIYLFFSLSLFHSNLFLSVVLSFFLLWCHGSCSGK